jgi:acetyl esterase/lipase
LNLQGGGFTIGHAIDDARWCATILKTHPNAVSISINYRLAPEYPFPTALEDSVDYTLAVETHREI